MPWSSAGDHVDYHSSDGQHIPDPRVLEWSSYLILPFYSRSRSRSRHVFVPFLSLVRLTAKRQRPDCLPVWEIAPMWGVNSVEVFEQLFILSLRELCGARTPGSALFYVVLAFRSTFLGPEVRVSRIRLDSYLRKGTACTRTYSQPFMVPNDLQL